METSHPGSVRSKIAKRLKEARVLAGLTQVAAAKIGISRPSLSEIEAGNRKVSAEAIIQFSDLYKVNALWLLNEGKRVGKRLPRK
jgi:transcriptional regulator with XRE-family HTH domain